ncbi:aminotransferase class III-fold pyridoxal phosphate-dependent enzyme [Ampullimonas aquatilis]|uniref:aminotransferase class III-fold pyridoxal phosphate-dependent enzyme n=1 Tax=Ampullimonas aquatilis TaxID=1341549 RepID=UPI003C74B96E
MQQNQSVLDGTDTTSFVKADWTLPGYEQSALNPDRHFLLNHIGFNKQMVKAEGRYFQDDKGNRYLDFLSQFGSVPFGHNPSCITHAIERVLVNKEPSLMQPFFSSAAEQLARQLIDVAPGKMRYVTYVNSGAEAAEAAIKLARAKTGKQRIVGAMHGYHGKTLGALSVTGNMKYHTPFLLDTTAFEFVRYNDLDALQTRLQAGDVAAFFVEPVQGEGGMRTPHDDYIAQASQICKAAGVLFVVDEIQTGLGRTGQLFATSHCTDLHIDILLLSKALGGGMVPLGAVLCRQDVWTEEFGLLHSSTFANNHLTCSVGLAVIEELLRDDQAVVKNAKEQGDYLHQCLQALVKKYPDAYIEARGKGLMQGLVMASWDYDNGYVLSHASTQGYSVPVLAGYLFNVHGIVTAPLLNQTATLRLQPSLNVTREEIDRVVNALDQAGAMIQARRFEEMCRFLVDAEPKKEIVAANQSIQKRPSYTPPKAAEQCLGKFAFLMHPTEPHVLFDALPDEFKDMTDRDRRSWTNWLNSWCSRKFDPDAVYHLPALRSAKGGYVEGWLIAGMLTPQTMLKLSKKDRVNLMGDYFRIAEKLDVDMVGLGAFTSVITRGGVDFCDTRLNITTGNSLTALASAESLIYACQQSAKPASKRVVGVVGAAGSVGRVAALHLSRFAPKIYLFGNPSNKTAIQHLSMVAVEIYSLALDEVRNDPDGAKHRGGIAAGLLAILPRHQLLQWSFLAQAKQSPEAWLNLFHEALAAAGAQPFVCLTVDIEGDLPKTNVVLSATGAGKSFINPAILAHDSLVCDVARPLDVMRQVGAARQDLLVYEGGIVKLPEDVEFGFYNVLGYPRGYNLACLSETIVLCMSGAQRSYSLGTTIPYDEALSVYEMARQHGFNFAILKDGMEIMTPQVREAV